MQRSLKRSVVALLGVGHTNAHIVRMWKMHPRNDADLVCISNDPIATYSGMLPGVLSGQYAPEQMEIDLVRLCQSAGARLIVDEVRSIDRVRKKILFDNRSPVAFDVMSIGIGSRPQLGQVDVSDDAPLEMIKPMPTFLRRLSARLAVIAQRPTEPIRAVVVGGGVAGIEVSFCLLTRLNKLFPRAKVSVTLVSGSTFAGGTAPGTQARLRHVLKQRAIDVLPHSVRSVSSDAVGLDNGAELPADLVLWATGAIAPALLDRLDLEKDDRGFLATQATLQTVSDESIFAVGDTGTLRDRPTAKAGVFAVRQGPVLWENIGRKLEGLPLIEYAPQRRFLKLMNTGNGKAVGEYGRFASYRTLMWKIKDRIDVSFMKKYKSYARMEPLLPLPGASEPMRCLGCGGKVSSESLRTVLAELQFDSEHALLGVAAAEDAAMVDWPGEKVTATVDYFAAPLDDPDLMGRIAAAHSASDCFAMGSRPVAALAVLQIPLGHPRGQRRVLREVLAGANDAFRKIGAAIVGGHTIEGPNLSVGFAVLATEAVAPLLKSALKPGDQLILTKPIGTGVLLAAHQRQDCRGHWYVELCRQMALGNEVCLELANRFSLQAATDVTGFGLAGHLLEMLHASQMAARLRLAEIPVLPGALELSHAGIESSLAPENRLAERQIRISTDHCDRAKLDLLFDPQTSGGMLLAVRERDVADVLNELSQHGFEQAAVIGSAVSPDSESAPAIELVD